MRNLSITLVSAQGVEGAEKCDTSKNAYVSQGVTCHENSENVTPCDTLFHVDLSVVTPNIEAFKNSLLTFRNLIASHYGDTEPSGNEQLTLPQRIAKGVAWVRTHPSDLNAIKALNGLRARETKMFERESDEADRMSEIERELCGDGRVICSECFEIYSVDRDCACGFWPWADGKRQEQEVRIAECQ